MRYKPKNISAQKLLKVAGYTGEGIARGYQRVINRLPSGHIESRLHAFIELDGAVKFHLDYNMKPDIIQHTTSMYSASTKRELARLKDIDINYAPLLVRIYRCIAREIRRESYPHQRT